MLNKRFAVLGGLALLAMAGCNNQGDTTTTTRGASSPGVAASPGADKPTIAVIPKGTTHSFWKSVEAGAQKAGAEVGANIVWKGPLKESDRAQQISIVEQFVADKADAIVLAPLDDTALVKPVRNAATRKIPVVIIDSALNGTAGEDFSSFVSTDNHQGGVLAGERLAKLLDGKGKVVLLRYQEGSASTVAREAGFMEVMKQNPGITMLVDNRYAGATAGEAKTAAMDMVDQLKQADGVFTPNESSTFGMLLALRQNNLIGKAKFVGFDASPPLLEALGKDEIDALVVQNPTKMGYEGVKTAYRALKGEKVEGMVDTGVAVIDKTNVETPEMQEILGGNK